MSKRSIVVPTGQLAPFAAGFRKELMTAGYSKSAAKKQLNLVVHLDSWLKSEALDVQALTSKRVEEFFAHRREQGRSNLLTARSLAPLVGFLHQSGVISVPEVQPASGAVDVMVERFSEYLLRQRGLVEGTVAFYRRVARRFLVDRFGEGPVDIGLLSAGDVTAFVTSACRPLSTSSARQSVSALRSFLRLPAPRASPPWRWIRRCCRWPAGTRRCPGPSRPQRSSGCWLAATGAVGSGGETTPS